MRKLSILSMQIQGKCIHISQVKIYQDINIERYVYRLIKDKI